MNALEEMKEMQDRWLENAEAEARRMVEFLKANAREGLETRLFHMPALRLMPDSPLYRAAHATSELVYWLERYRMDSSLYAAFQCGIALERAQRECRDAGVGGANL